MQHIVDSGINLHLMKESNKPTFESSLIFKCSSTLDTNDRSYNRILFPEIFEETKGNSIQIQLEVYSLNEYTLSSIIQLKEHINYVSKLYNLRNLDVSIMFKSLPYSSSYKKSHYSDINLFKIAFANVINSLNFSKVILLDPENYSVEALLDNSVIIDQYKLVLENVKDLSEYTALVSIDLEQSFKLELLADELENGLEDTLPIVYITHTNKVLTNKVKLQGASLLITTSNLNERLRSKIEDIAMLLKYCYKVSKVDVFATDKCNVVELLSVDNLFHT